MKHLTWWFRTCCPLCIIIRWSMTALSTKYTTNKLCSWWSATCMQLKKWSLDVKNLGTTDLTNQMNSRETSTERLIVIYAYLLEGEQPKTSYPPWSEGSAGGKSQIKSLYLKAVEQSVTVPLTSLGCKNTIFHVIWIYSCTQLS